MGISKKFVSIVDDDLDITSLFQDVLSNNIAGLIAPVRLYSTKYKGRKE